MPWIANMDLLGTKRQARRSSIDRTFSFSGRLERFQNVVGQSAVDNRSITIRFYSDSAYLESDDFEELAKTLAKMRYDLLIDDIYFRAAVCEGRLEDNLWHPATDWSEKRGWHDKHAERRVHGYRFGESAVKAYELQEGFPGIGILIDSHIDTNLIVRGLAFRIESDKAAFEARRKELYVSYHDLKFYFNEETVDIGLGRSSFDDTSEMILLLDKTYQRMRFLSLTSPRVVAKYFTLLINIAQSFEVGELQLVERNASKTISGLPDCISDFLNNHRWRFFRKNVGFSELIAISLQKIYLAYEEKLQRALRGIYDPDRDLVVSLERYILRSVGLFFPKKSENGRYPILEMPDEILRQPFKDYLLDKWSGS